MRVTRSSTPVKRKKTSKRNCGERLLESLPSHLRSEYLELWLEFEAGESPEAKIR
ncbi:HD domain-containing protein [Vibrio chagasii]|nr:HD domain-containing protein [Vibrio chagasii]